MTDRRFQGLIPDPLPVTFAVRATVSCLEDLGGIDPHRRTVQIVSLVDRQLWYQSVTFVCIEHLFMCTYDLCVYCTHLHVYL